MRCLNCNKEISEQSRFCTACGKPVPRCPTCGKVLTKFARFCTNDGTPIPKEIMALLPPEGAAPAVKPAAPVQAPAEKPTAPVQAPAEKPTAPVQAPVEKPAAPVQTPAEKPVEDMDATVGVRSAKPAMAPAAAVRSARSAQFAAGETMSGMDATAAVRNPARARCASCGRSVEPGRKVCTQCAQTAAEMRGDATVGVNPVGARPAAPAAAAAPVARFCIRCGSPSADGQKICAACRAKEQPIPAAVPVSREQPASKAKPPKKKKPEPVKTKPEKEKKKGAPVVLIVLLSVLLLLLLALAGIGVYSLVGDGLDGLLDDFILVQDKDQDDDKNNDDAVEEDTEEATEEMTEEPTEEPTPAPTEAQTEAPTQAPTEAPTEPPTEAPTEPDPLTFWIENCDSVYLSEADLEGFDAETCRLARNAIFAKSGRKFSDAGLTSYFSQFDWYNPTVEPDNFANSMLNTIQTVNLELIMAYEEAHGYR